MVALSFADKVTKKRMKCMKTERHLLHLCGEQVPSVQELPTTDHFININRFVIETLPFLSE